MSEIVWPVGFVPMFGSCPGYEAALKGLLGEVEGDAKVHLQEFGSKSLRAGLRCAAILPMQGCQSYVALLRMCEARVSQQVTPPPLFANLPSAQKRLPGPCIGNLFAEFVSNLFHFQLSDPAWWAKPCIISSVKQVVSPRELVFVLGTHRG